MKKASTGEVTGRIFMSYRRQDAAYPAAWLYDRLITRFGREQVFKDIDSIELGDDFLDVITKAVASCQALLVLIGSRWLTITDQDGQQRLDNPSDFVRLEIEAALAHDIRVIPILVEGTRMPRAEELPASLAMLARRQALELSANRFDADTGRLLGILDRTIRETVPRLPKLTGVDPSTGPVGTNVRLTGARLTEVTGVVFGVMPRVDFRGCLSEPDRDGRPTGNWNRKCFTRVTLWNSAT